MLCGFREVSRFVKTTRIHLKHATYIQCTVEIGHFALYPVRLKSISDPFKNIRNETIYQCGNCAVCLSVRLRQQFSLALAFNLLQNDHWQYLFKTSLVDRLWWALPIVTFVCDIDLEGTKFQGQICYWCLTSLYLDHGQLLFNTSDVDRPWWVLSIVTFVCDLNLEGSKFQGQICNWHLTWLYLHHGQ